MVDLTTLAYITGLALADAVNVCALAVLAIVLVTILTKNPDNPKEVLKAGLSFVSAVFIMYLFYAFILVQIFGTLNEQLKGISFYVHNGIAILAMLIGALNIKDYFIYQPGGIATEMPMSIRPRIKLLIKRISSPSGAFVIGIFVTIFLLTCTIWPLIIAAGKLSYLGFLGALPWFIYYNIIFVLPMLAITLFIYLGYTTVENVSGWKERNIRRLHLIAGILLFLVGLSLVMGWI